MHSSLLPRQTTEQSSRTALALDRGAEANQPLALAVVGGLTSSTILSLFVVPVIFLALVRRPPESDPTARDRHLPPPPAGDLPPLAPAS